MIINFEFSKLYSATVFASMLQEYDLDFHYIINELGNYKISVDFGADQWTNYLVEAFNDFYRRLP